MRRLLYGLGATALLLIAAGVAGFAVLQTQAGQIWLAAALSRALSSETGLVTISGLRGNVPASMHVDRIDVSDTDGTWLRIDDATIKLRLRDLLQRRLTLEALTVRGIDVRRMPISEDAGAKPSQPFSLPRLPIDIAIESVAVDRVHLEQPVLGEAVALHAVGHGGLTGKGAAAQLAVDRTDNAGRLHLDFRLGRDDVLALHLDASEPSGAVLRRLLDAPEPLPIDIAVHGEGPVDSWEGSVEAAAGAQDRLHATVKLERHGPLRLTSGGSLSLHHLLPPPLRQIMAGPISFAVQANFADQHATLERLSIESSLAMLTAQGDFDTDDRRFSGSAEISAPDLRPIGTMLETPLGGAAAAQIKANGTLDAPRVDVTLQGAQLQSVIRADRLTLSMQGTKDGETWSVQGNGDAAGLVWPGDRAGLPDTLALTFDSAIDQQAMRLTLNSLTLRSAGAEIAASGTLDKLDTAPQGAARITVTSDDLGRWRDLAGLPLGGHMTIASDLRFDGGTVDVRIKGDSTDLVTGDPRLDAVLGKRLDLRATAKRAAHGVLVIDDVKIAGADLAVAGSARIDADLASAEARLDLDLPRLAVLSDALGAPTQGSAKMRAHLTGPLAAPQAQIDAEANGLRFGARQLDRLTLNLALSDALAPIGTLTASLKTGALNATADAAFARTGTETIEISRLAVRAPGSEANGALSINTARLGASGTMTAHVADLSPWSPLAGTALAGAVDARITLANKDGQRADVDATLRDLRLDDAGAAAGRVKVEVRMSDLLGKPAGRASVDATALTLPDLRLDSLRASAQSIRPDQFAVSIDSHGVLRPATDAQHLQLAATGEIALSANERRIRVTRLTSRVGDYAILSRTPLTVALNDNAIKVDGLDLGVGGGRVTGAVSRTPSGLAAQLQARNLPLALIQIALPRQKIGGVANASIRMGGTTTRPDGQVELDLRDVRVGAAGNLPPFSATALGTWKSQAFDIVGQIAAPDGTKLDLRGSVPLKLDAATMAPALVQDGALRATLKGNGHLERWAALLPLGEDRIAGRYAVDLSVDGTPAQPAPHGRLTISDGRYVNFAAGTEISDVVAEIGGDGEHFVLSRLIGRDGAKGTLGGRGAVEFLPSGPTFDVTARFANFGFMRREDVTASGDGEIRLAGTPEAAKLSGRVRIDRAEIRIPERLPPSIPNLPVVEVDSRNGEVLSTPDKAAGGAIALAVDVDIPGRTFVRGRGLDSEWRGAVQVGGTTAAPQLMGKLETVRGDFSLLGKRFALSDSTITFMGGEKIDPQLAITAQYQTAAILAQAAITGTVSDPSIRLTSQPEMPQDEVLARVLFGRSVTEMTPAQGFELAQAAATLAGKGGPGILDRVRAATGLDRLDISSKEPSASGGPSGTTVTAGEYVSDRVFVGVEQGFKADSTRPKVEVEITPNVTVESSVGSSSAGVGVNWKWDY